ncbi:cell adhesion molecule L1 like [Homo sapiens]|uniref:Cell adhesion molecule L1 like n=1 Tax=Homo sapiens TaxID=9606 RepID=F8WEP4_HUMAN|nr:cell adhesion molecule L1 like [Homo sapiens]
MPPAWSGESMDRGVVGLGSTKTQRGARAPPPQTAEGREGAPGAVVAMAPGSGARGAGDAGRGWSLLPLCASLFLSLFFFFWSVSVRGEAARRK